MPGPQRQPPELPEPMRRTEKAAALSAVAYVFMGSDMIAAALATGSVSMTAEGIHTLTDSVTSVAVLIGLRLSERHSKPFPFGLYKLENLIAMAIGLLILFGAYELVMESVRQLTKEPEALENPVLVLIVMAVSMPLMGLIAWYENRVAREENSPGLGANARHGQDILFRVKEIAESHQGVKKVLGVEGRNSGSYRFLSLTIVTRTADLEKANHVAEEIRSAISKEIANVDRFNVFLQTEVRENILCAVPLDHDLSGVSTHFGEAHAFSLNGIKLPGGDRLEGSPGEPVHRPVQGEGGKGGGVPGAAGRRASPAERAPGGQGRPLRPGSAGDHRVAGSGFGKPGGSGESARRLRRQGKTRRSSASTTAPLIPSGRPRARA